VRGLESSAAAVSHSAHDGDIELVRDLGQPRHDRANLLLALAQLSAALEVHAEEACADGSDAAREGEGAHP